MAEDAPEIAEAIDLLNFEDARPEPTKQPWSERLLAKFGLAKKVG